MKGFAALHESDCGTKRRKPRRRVYVSFWASSGSASKDGLAPPSTRMTQGVSLVGRSKRLAGADQEGSGAGAGVGRGMARELAVEFGEHKVMPLARRNSVPAEASRGRAVDDEARARKRLRVWGRLPRRRQRGRILARRRSGDRPRSGRGARLCRE
jgi:hypothetical protein